jgi:secreted trypsin-like serine protease
VFVAILNASAPQELVWANSFCSGVLVAPDVVVTAAHCLGDGPRPDVLVGVENLCEGAFGGERIAVTAIVFGSGEATGLALLRLADEASFVPATLATGSSPSSGLVATGWGRRAVDKPRPCQSKRVELALVDEERCSGAISSAKEAGVLPGSYACMVPEGAANTCLGDSGSGVYSMADGAAVLHGVTLGGLGCGARQAGLYASPVAVAALLQQDSTLRVTPGSSDS